MSKLMTRLEKLSDFTKRDEELKARAKAISIEMDSLNNEFVEFIHTEFQMPKDQPMHMSAILKTALETSYEQSPRIILP
jgi:hypothetical protein